MINQNELDILYKLKKEVEKSDHQSLVTMINQIIKKVYLNHYTLTFVGHFSAGKSTLINNLIERDILPSSPVPTTSNTALVSVSNEEGITANLEGQKYSVLENYDAVKQMNRENYHVESIDIRFKSNLYHDGLTFQDTPGVDSNVKSHSISTESFLYTSNIVFYTVDYNHVQSSLNFQFMKRLNQSNIPVVFVINQIDKHKNDELSFEMFKSRVQKSIIDWDIDILKTFYVSKYDDVHNQLDSLKSFIHEQDNKRETIESYVNRITQLITSKQSQYLDDEMDTILDQLNIEAQEFEQAYSTYQQNEAVSEEAQLLNDKQALKHYLTEKRKSIIDNAYIMTHDMREHIRYYLESTTKDFKVGSFLNKKKKTEAERQNRLEQLMTKLQSKVVQNIFKPMQDDMSFLTRFSTDSKLNQRILNQHFELPTSLVIDLNQTQINISNQYVLTFSDDLMKSIRHTILKHFEKLDDDILEKVHAEENTASHSDIEKLYQRYIELGNLKRSLETRNYKHYYIHMDDSLDQLIDRHRIEYKPQGKVKIEEENTSSTKTFTKIESAFSKSKVVSALKDLRDVPLFQNTIKNIEHSLDRMDRQIIKIGVFGTFSAGKSSLINALLGAPYLISSPNPTTAATTEISYGNQNSVTFKTKEALLEEINSVTDMIGLQFETIAQFLSFNTSQLKLQIDKNRLAFIEAIEKNYQLYEQLIEKGIQHSISNADIQKWSAEDEYATFVDTVHIQLPIDWLKNKIIIDSLGLHSNNQRHTHETEKILTTSDLIIYVSYFNHSFTDNDKMFIQHMKDMNQLLEQQAFKMVINATDLAESDNDKKAVIQYVEQALSEVQMSPEIFAVSSRNALTHHDKGIEQLTDSIQHFAHVESKQILERNIVHQIEYIQQAYFKMIQDYETNAQETENHKQALQQLALPSVFNQQQIIDATYQKVSNEIDTQIYHLNERLKIQLLDDIKSVFNSQMTNTDDFKYEKQAASKMYLDQIHQKLYLEQSLIVERIKRIYQQELESKLIPTLKQLHQHHVIIQPDVQFDISEIDQMLLKIDLESLIRQLPKSLTKKRILQSHYQKEIHESIKISTLTLLGPRLNDLKHALESILNEFKEQSVLILNQLEDATQEDIQSILTFELDDAFIQKLKSILPTLTHITSFKGDKNVE
ncbi:dynamin family protein [Staphylococcus felis]|uniref:Dynamin family protein n=1 Tax=Staphylococcus felis TaxID=46127 RepID=A0A3E0IRF3_9STAP|nr:dynamin family protein [Staphylococcus felis]REH98621.1 dynamin family protein [Staphylococcus felis]